MIDTDHLAQSTAGDPKLESELLGLFQAQLGDFITTIGKPDTASAAEWRLRVHRLRGAALALGARRLADALAAAEASLDGEPRKTGAAAVLAALRNPLAETAAAVDSLIAARRGGGLAKLG